ncbi:MAG TPA: TrkA family potassium uptake protein [Acidobacteriota bacterium]|nr:TrkA family potassium uptake protein [Acidobacteriota bacterium]
MKQFAIIGLGNFGATVAAELTKLKCKVTAVDIDRGRVQGLPDRAHQAILADATDRAFLQQLGVSNYDCFVVSTGKDWHASVLITLHLKELGAARVIVKANSADHAKVLERVGATQAIIPEQQMARSLSHSLANPNLVDYLPLSGEYCVAELVPPAGFVGKQLLELQLRTKYHVQVIAVKDTRTAEYDFVPGGDYTIRATDVLIVLGRQADVEKLKV